MRARECMCGSGLDREAQHDARGIFLTYTCRKCRREKMRGFRAEVFSDATYEADEDIEGEGEP